MFYLGEHKKDTNFEQAYLLLHTVNNGIQYIRLLHKTSSFNLDICVKHRHCDLLITTATNTRDSGKSALQNS